MAKMFEVTVDNRGTIEKKTIEAKDKSEAAFLMRDEGQVIKVVKKTDFSLVAPIEIYHRQVIFIRLATMLETKVPTGRALSLMEEHYSGPIGRTCSKLKRQIDSGKTISEAMKSLGSKYFPDTVVALVESGIQASSTSEALKQAAIYEKEMQDIKKGNMLSIYASIVYIIIAAAMIFGTTRIFGPMMMEMPIMKNVDIDDMYVKMGNIGEIVSVLLVGGLIILVFLGTVGRFTFPKFADNIIVRVPYYKDLVLAKNNYLTMYSMSLLTQSGVSMDTTLKLASKSARKGKMKSDLENALELNKVGKLWATSMSSLHPTDRAALSHANDRTAVTNALSSLANQYKELYRSRINQLGPTLQMFAILCLIWAGGVMYGQTMQPIMLLMSKGF